MKHRSDVHKHYIKNTENDKTTYSCKYCYFIYNSRNASRFKLHLNICNSCPDEVKQQFPISEGSFYYHRLQGHSTEGGQPRKPRKSALSVNFNVVKRKCVELVRNGFPAAIIDDEAFQGILALIPMNDESRKALTAEYIQKLVAGDDVDETQIDEDDDDDYDPLQGNDDFDDDEQDSSMQRGAVKVEIEPTDECTCAQKDTDAHELDCPMASKLLPYLNYYELSDDEAKCTLCRSKIKWTEVTELKEHLDKLHPNIQYERQPKPSHPEFLDSDSYFDEPSEKRRKTKEKERERERREERENREERGVKEKKEEKFSFFDENEDFMPAARKRPRLTDITLKSNEKIPMDQFRLLDRFGLYVAALLENLPKDKCIKYQQQIIDRLLKEQAAAG